VCRAPPVLGLGADSPELALHPVHTIFFLVTFLGQFWFFFFRAERRFFFSIYFNRKLPTISNHVQPWVFRAWSAAFYALHLPSVEACTGWPREVLKESSKMHGDCSARRRVKVLSMPTIAHWHQLMSNKCKKTPIFLSLLNSIWLSYCIHLDKRKYSENVHHYMNDDCINIMHFNSKHLHKP